MIRSRWLSALLTCVALGAELLGPLRARAATTPHAVVVRPDGSVWSWRKESVGDSLVKVSGLSSITSAAASASWVYIVRRGELWSWNPSSSERFQLFTPEPVRSVACSGERCLAITIAERVLAWSDGTEPAGVPGLEAISAVAIGEGHFLALGHSGLVFAWGMNSRGQLGSGSFEPSATPVLVGGLAGVESIAAGRQHSLAARADGTAWGWGANAAAQLGLSDAANRPAPVAVPGLQAIAKVAAAGDESVVLGSDGALRRLGTGDPTPIALEGPRPTRAVRFENGSLVAHEGDGSIWVSTPFGDSRVEDARFRSSVTQAPVPPANGTLSGSAALVVGPGSLSASDLAILARLEGLGLTVGVVPQSSASPAAVSAFSLVVISSSVTSEQLDPGLADVAVPVVSWDPFVWSRLGMLTSARLPNHGALPGRALSVVRPNHPLAARLDGSAVLLDEADEIPWAQPTAGARVVAVGPLGHAGLFAYDAGDATALGPAPARRVALPIPAGRAEALTADGWRLFDAGLAWASGATPETGRERDDEPDPAAGLTGGSGTILFVVGSTSLSDGDAAMKSRMEASGFTVEVKLASASATSDATGKKLVLVSHTAPNIDVLEKFKYVAVPVAIQAEGIVDDMAMTTDSNRGGCTSPAVSTDSVISTPSHPIAMGRTGTLTLSTSPGALSRGTPSSNGVMVLTCPSDNSKATNFTYEKNVSMEGLTAPERRVYWGFREPIPQTFTLKGADFFERMIFWAANTPAASNSAPVVSAGPDQAAIVNVAITLNGSVEDDGLPVPPDLTRTWYPVSGPGSVTFGSLTSAVTTAMFSQPGTYVVRLIASDGQHQVSDEATITVSLGNTAPAVNAGLDKIVEMPDPVTLVGSVTDDGLPNPPASLSIGWSYTGPGAVTFGSGSSATTTATFSTTGTYVLRLSANDTAAVGFDDVIVTVSPSVLLVVGNTTLSTADAYLKSRIEAIGFPVAVKKDDQSATADATGRALVWVSSTASDSAVGTKFLNVTVPVAVQTGTLSTSMKLSSATVGIAADQTQVTVTAPTSSLAAGLLGTVNTTGVAGYAWGTPAASAVKVLSLASDGNKHVLHVYEQNALLADGSSTAPERRLFLGFQSTALNGLTNEGKKVLDNAIRWLTRVNAAPWVDAGPDKAATLAGPSVAVSLDGRVTDEGIPAAVTATWSRLSGPAAVTFGNVSQPATSATFTQTGDYVLQLTATDTAKSASDLVFVTIIAPGTNNPPVVSAGPDQVIRFQTAQLNAMAGDDGLPSGTLTKTWETRSGPGTATFTPINEPTSSVSFPAPGVYVLRITVSDGALSAFDELNVVVEQNAAALLVVANAGSLNADDTRAKQELETMGFVVTVKDAGTPVTAGDANGKTVVAISDTASAAIGSMFTSATVPVVVWKSDLLDDLGMTGTLSGTDFGTHTGKQVTIVTPGHLLASVFSGTQSVYLADANLSWGKPGSNAIAVATVPGDANKATLFAYETGSAMVSGTAPARRVAVFAPRTLTNEGVSLFRAALRWATDRSVKALLVTAGASPSSSEAVLRERLAALGFGVSTKPAATTTALDAVGKAVVVMAKDAVPPPPAGGLDCPAVPVGASASYVLKATTGTSSADWVAQYSPGAPDTPWIGGGSGWGYVPLPRPATVSLVAPSTAGTYEARLFANDGFTKLASCTFQVNPALSVGDATVTEGHSGTLNAAFTVTLARAGSTSTVTVAYATADASATAGSDYTAASGTLTFGPSETTKTVNVTVSGDTTAEPSETFFMNLGSPSSGVMITDGQGLGTITNDDGALPPAPPVGNEPINCPVSVAPSGTFNVKATTGSSSLDWVAMYTPGAPNTPWIGSYAYVPLPRPREVTLTAPATAGSYEVRFFANDTYSLIDSCPLPVGGVLLSIGNVTVAEGNSGTSNANFTVTATPAPSSTITVSYATASISATAGSDYTSTSGILTFLATETSKTISVPILGDTLDEPAEAFFLNLSSPSAGATLGNSAQALGVISNDDVPALRDVTVPLVVADATLFSSLGLTYAALGIDYGTVASQTQVNILDPTHPLAAGLTGLRTVVSSADTFNWGIPPAAAVKAASQMGDIARATVFGYEFGKAMVGLSAPDRRVGLFLGANSGAVLTADGNALFDAAVMWAARSDPDGDGLSTFDEYLYGTDPRNADTNGDGIPDGVAIATGLSATNLDMDGDGLSNADELLKGTDPFNPDTDGDTHLDGVDCFPLDKDRWDCPGPSDPTPPVITLIFPTNATLISVVPPIN